MKVFKNNIYRAIVDVEMWGVGELVRNTDGLYYLVSENSAFEILRFDMEDLDRFSRRIDLLGFPLFENDIVKISGSDGEFVIKQTNNSFYVVEYDNGKLGMAVHISEVSGIKSTGKTIHNDVIRSSFKKFVGGLVVEDMIKSPINTEKRVLK